MRTSIFVLAVTLALPCAAQTTSVDCAKFADRFSNGISGLSNLAQGLEDSPAYAGAIGGSEELNAAIADADAARNALVPALRSYVAAMQDLTYQLQLCARQ